VLRVSAVTIFAGAAIATVVLPVGSAAQPGKVSVSVEASILLYHRFAPVVHDSMTVRTTTFRAQLEYLKQQGYPIIPLRWLVNHLLGKEPTPPPRAVVIVVDDGHASVFTEMLPLVREYRVPVTLFIYPSAISNASYAMKWDQLAALSRTGLFDIESHTYWHPNFKTEKRRLSPEAYRSFVTMQFTKPRTVLRDKLGVNATMLAWPFGIYDDDLIASATQSGYAAGFTLDRRLVTPRERMMALPRFLVLDSDSGRRFAAMLPR
ncbi:MAG TPA: polysaccharide deacetylase family protein, partial [Vicinamibacterales bacterium]|nr:polysaccharide deacetylase family protein [Vicinamibacterales bacterium]